MKKFILLGVAAVSSLSGCATLVGGEYQTIYVSTTHGYEQVTDATCSLMNDKGTWVVHTPARVTVRRAYTDLVINCTKDQYDRGAVTANSSTKGLLLYNGLIGDVIDISTRAAYDYPSQITVDMGAVKMISPPVNAP
jgi:hypothetical protein